MGNEANKEGYHNAWQGGRRIGQSNQSASKIGCNINVIGKEPGEHGTHGDNAHRHDRDGFVVATANEAQDQQTDARNNSTNRGGSLSGAGGANFAWKGLKKS